MPTEQLAPDNAFVVRFIQDLVRAAAQRGHHILVFTENGDELEAFGKLVARHGVDGFILSGSRVDDPRVQFLAKAAIPSAMFGRAAPDLPQTWVDIDSVAAVGAMVDHLVERGHREFAYLGDDARNSWDLERLEGYRSGLARHGIDAAARSIVKVRTTESIHGAVRRLLNRKHRPTPTRST